MSQKFLYSGIALAICCALGSASVQAQSRGSLFDDDSGDEPDTAAPAATSATAPSSTDKPAALSTSVDSTSGIKYSGSVGLDVARTVGSPEHWSHERLRSTLNVQGNTGLKWKLGARVDADAAYATHNDGYYPSDVRNDQKVGLELLENYFDASVGGMELRVGKQYVVWGEMVGLFVADVVSPRDMRDFYQVDLTNVRRTTWAMRLEKFAGDWHHELLWVPVQTYDNSGKPGSDFYRYPAAPTPGFNYVINKEQIPERSDLSNGSFGARTGFLQDGWDVSAFVYESRDIIPTYERSITYAPVPTTTYTAVHDRIWQLGGTVAKDVGGVVLKSEAVWTAGRRYGVARLDEDDGLVRSDAFTWAVGLDFVPTSSSRLNAQIFQTILTKHDWSMGFDKVESMGSLMYTYTLNREWEAQALWATSLNRNSGWVNPLLTYKPWPSTRLRWGADFFYGSQTSALGQYDHKDRVYMEVLQSF